MKQATNKSMKVLILEPVSDTPSRLAAVFKDHLSYNSSESHYSIDHVLSCPFGPEVAEVFKKFHPDLVLVDLEHAGPNSLDFCRELRAKERDRHTGFIFHSHSIHADDRIFEQVIGCGADDCTDARASNRELVARANSVFRFKVMADRLRLMNHRLKMLSLTDELTGLSNMRAFNIDYQKLIKNCQKNKHGLGMIMLDLDYFKSVNDSSTHLVGSFVIGEIGRLIAHSGVLGPGTAAARYGGDEYIICSPVDSVETVRNLAEKIRDLIMRSVFKREHHTIKLTGSFGVAWVDPGFDGSTDDLIKAADVMLYRSKRLGRNRVSTMILRYPVDFGQIGHPHVLEPEGAADQALKHPA